HARFEVDGQEPLGRPVEGKPEPSAGEQAIECSIVGEEHAHRGPGERGLDAARKSPAGRAAVLVAPREARPVFAVVRLTATDADGVAHEGEVHTEVQPDPVVLLGPERARHFLGIREVAHAVPALAGLALGVFLALRRALTGASDARQTLLALHGRDACGAPPANADPLLRSGALR